MPIQTLNPRNQTTQSFTLSLVFSPDLSTITDVHLTYNNQTITVITMTPMTSDQIQSFLTKVPNYLLKIDTAFAANPNLSGNISIAPDKNTLLIGGYSLPIN